MQRFAQLLENLYFTYSHKEKLNLLLRYYKTTRDPDRGYAVAIITSVLNFKLFKPALIRQLIEERVDPTLFHLSYDYVGDLSETVALLWPESKVIKSNPLPTLGELVQQLETLSDKDLRDYLIHLLDISNTNERLALLKIAVGNLRIGISARFIKQSLAAFGGKSIQEIEELWHALSPPYQELFAWLEHKGPKPEKADHIYFHPVMLSHPLEEELLHKISQEHFFAEWKFDGIRIQIVSTPFGKGIYSRKGDDISTAFPDLVNKINFHAVLDGELVIRAENEIKSFNDLQQRLNRKKPSADLMREAPAHVILYDVLALEHKDMRPYPLVERRAALEKWLQKIHPDGFSLSPLLRFKDASHLIELREETVKKGHVAIEGLMLKRKSSPYLPGRPKGHWYKWKKNPYLLDAVLMYAQRGQGKRSSYYSDFTFGLWHNDHLTPIGKAYFGFSDDELYQLDKWIRNHTLQKFGPVREVEKALVFEVAFDSVQQSNRHKSGFALRFPRINRIRWDKPAHEADVLETLRAIYEKNI